MPNPTAQPLVLQIEGQPSDTAAIWLETSLKGVFPKSTPGSTNLSLLLARNGKASFQVCVRNQGLQALGVRREVDGGKETQASS